MKNNSSALVLGGIALASIVAVVVGLVLLSPNDVIERSQPQPAPATSAAEPPPEKYTARTPPTCEDLADRMPGLPPNEARLTFRSQLPHSTEFKLECVYIEAAPSGGRPSHKFTLVVSAFQNDPDSQAAGADEARAVFESGVANGGEEVGRPEFGERAAWLRLLSHPPAGSPTWCDFSVLDGNAVMRVARWGVRDPASNTDDYTSQTCRIPTAELAERFHAALQELHG